MHDQMSVRAEGVFLATGLTTAAGEFQPLVQVVTVSDRELKIVFSDDGGADPNWVLNAVTIEIDANDAPS